MSFAGLTMKAPKGWHDESTIVLTKANSIVDPRLGALSKGSGGPEASLTVKWEPMPKDGDLQRYLLERLDELRNALPGVEVVEAGSLTELDAEASFVELQLENPLPLRQIVIARQVGDRVVVVTGSALPVVYQKLHPLFVETAASIMAEQELTG